MRSNELKTLLALGLAGVLLSGCSFRASGWQDGRILSLSTYGHIGVDSPITVRAVAEFTGAVERPVLSVRLASGSSDVLTVSAVADGARHAFGLGIFPPDRTTPHRLDLEATVTLDRPGTYLIEGLSARAGVVTATQSLQVY